MSVDLRGWHLIKDDAKIIEKLLEPEVLKLYHHVAREGKEVPQNIERALQRHYPELLAKAKRYSLLMELKREATNLLLQRYGYGFKQHPKIKELEQKYSELQKDLSAVNDQIHHVKRELWLEAFLELAKSKNIQLSKEDLTELIRGVEYW